MLKPIILATLPLLLPLPAALVQAAGGRGMADMRTAQTYATRAAQETQLGQVRADLRRALDCLEGPQGKDFRKSVGDPCRSAGAVNELPDGSVNKIRVQKAIRLAAVGATFHDFDPAHLTAKAVEAVLLEGTRGVPGD